MTRGKALSGRRVRSAETRALIQQSAIKQAHERKQAVTKAVCDAMTLIETEITTNGGVYPHNGGELPFVEITRRAGIDGTTLYSSRYKDLAGKVRDWLATIKAGEGSTAAESSTTRRSAAERVADWRELYGGLLESHRIAELDLQEAKRELEDALEAIQVLKSENERLEKLLGNVIPMRR